MKKQLFKLTLLSGFMFLTIASCSRKDDSPNDATPKENSTEVITKASSMSVVNNPASVIFGGGPVYINAAANISELRASGFNTVVVWTIHIDASGNFNFNMEFPLVSNGSYIGASTHSDFASNMALLKQAPTSINRIEFSLSGWGGATFQNVKNLIASQGTGTTSTLYKNFKALKTAIPSIDAIDFDDESTYDVASSVNLAVMLKDIGYNVTLCPYTNSSYWTSVSSQTNSQRAGAVDLIYLQCYSGGSGNTPCSGWNFNGVPLSAGLWGGSGQMTASQIQTKLAGWKSSCGLNGGFIWLYDGIKGSAAQYASAINTALANTTGVVFYQNSNYGGTATGSLPKGNFTLSQLQGYGFVNDWASSVKIPSGWKVIMYNDNNYLGTSWTLTTSNTNFTQLSPSANDLVSSVKIQ